MQEQVLRNLATSREFYLSFDNFEAIETVELNPLQKENIKFNDKRFKGYLSIFCMLDLLLYSGKALSDPL